jgi:hypothetical protein
MARDQRALDVLRLPAGRREPDRLAVEEASRSVAFLRNGGATVYTEQWRLSD